jgi:tetratricopeptide (TPR) repeat protein
VTLVCLDFFHQDPQLSEMALNQLLSLQQGTAQPLMDLADLALGSERYELAQRAMARALVIEPRFLRQTIRQSIAHPTLELSEIVPKELEYRREAVQQILALIGKTPELQSQYQSFLAASLSALDVEQAEGLDARVSCLKTRVQLGFFLDKPDLAIASANQLAQEGGADVNTHISFLKMMQQAGRIPEAIVHAELVLKSAPGSKRLREQLKSLYLLEAQQ